MPSSLTHALGLLAMSCAASVAHAELTVSAGGKLRYDDNVFRISRQIAAARGVARSDRTYELEGQLDAAFHPGAFDVNAMLRVAHEWYDRNSNLDNSNYTGTLSIVRDDQGFFGTRTQVRIDRRLSSFSDIRNGVSNIQQLQSLDNRSTFALTPELRLVVTPRFARGRNSAASVKANDFDRYGVGVGIGYFTPLGNSIALTVSRQYTDGQHSRLVTIGSVTANSPIDVVDTAANLSLRYDLSVFTSIAAELSYVDRNDRSLIDGDYHGPSGRLSLALKPTDTIGLVLTGGRRLESQTSLFVDAVKSDYVSLALSYQLTDTLDLNSSASFERRRFQIDPLALGTTENVQKSYGLDASLSYRPADRFELKLSGGYDRRRSDLAASNFSASTAMLSARYIIGDNGGGSGK